MEKAKVPAYCADFIQNGYCIVPLPDRALLDRVRGMLVAGLRAHIRGGDGLSEADYLNRFHTFVDPEKLNDARVKVHREVGASEEFRNLVFSTVQSHLENLVGNELVMQRQVSFVVHMPRDKTSLLYLHTDSWSGCSPYEVILWLPLVDVYATKSMYLCSKEDNRKHLRDLRDGLKLESAVELFKKVKPDTKPLDMKYGEALLFSPILLHGAEENLTDETRFILNVRFKSLFSPYGTKALGETFLPINFRPATEMGLAYEAEFGVVRG